MSRRPEVSQRLTQPHSVTCRHSNSDPNRGLYPRTPTKRKSDASDDKQQQGITQFFPVIGPQKAALSQGSGSIKTEGFNGELIPKKEPVEEKEALATPMKEEPEDEKVDYLEGLTTDMFGDDKEFERCWLDPAPAFMNHHDEEGHVDDLPEEVLMLVLSLLPAEDLYCHVSLVCQRWGNIVTQSLVRTWDRGRKLGFMAQYKPSQRVKPEAVLQSVRTHCLFPQAEACIKHRLPKLEGIEGGPNPWAAMTLMLVLCDGVGDVLDLVVCLRGCLLSASAITEYLSAMATMLLAMRRKDINISNRWHYNIFYVLHLIENPLPTAITNQSGRAQVQVTHEQQQILNHDIHRDHVVKIMAFAGCVQGKAVDSLRPLTTGLSPGRGKLAVLSRSNVSVYDQAVRLTDDNPRCRLHIVGGLENFGLNRIMDIWVLMQPENNRSRGDILEDEWNLPYVAVTRAKSYLVITKNINNILTLAGVCIFTCLSLFFHSIPLYPSIILSITL
ncbi:unnamed protein product [Coregonus sp. 'balchen']|nr:unnamed protein product [Coregonus sp. 'balchen']